MVSFIHTGDLHLGLKFHNVSFNRDKAKDRRRELWTTFENIVDHGDRNGFDFLLIAGDLFESAYFTIADINRIRDSFKGAEKINIVISAGNHDYMGRNSLYSKVEWPENVHIFGPGVIERKEFPHLNTVIYGYSWDSGILRDKKLLEGLGEQVDQSKNNILLLHGDLAADSDYLPLNMRELNSLNMDYIGLGHIHKPQIFSQKIAYCGCPEPLNFGEKEERGIIQGYIENKETRVEFLPFSKRKFIESELELEEDMGYPDIVKLVKAINLGNKEVDFFRVNLGGYIQRGIDIKNLKRDLEDSFYHIEIIDRTRWDYDLQELEMEHEGNIIQHFIQAMREKDLDNPITKRALYLGLEELLRGDNR
ncbi:MAG: DNA repair exonuclease [Tissierellaceae bacterium]